LERGKGRQRADDYRRCGLLRHQPTVTRRLTGLPGQPGEAYAYKFPLFCKAPSSTRLLAGGLPPSPVAGIVLIDVDGKPKKVPFIIGGGKSGSSFAPEQPKPAVPPVRRRQFWHINNAQSLTGLDHARVRAAHNDLRLQRAPDINA